MAKIKNDKYYTPKDVAKKVVDRAKKVIGTEKITEFLEPSAGEGVFLEFFDKPFMAYDIEPEKNNILKEDFLKVNISYKPGRCVIGNPPFGNKNLLAIKFFKKSIEIADYIAFLLPISQLNNNRQMFQFDLLSSEDMGIQCYSGKNIHCCLNIFGRPTNGTNKKSKTKKIKGIEIREVRKARKQYLPQNFSYDVAMCAWGSVGKKVDFQGQYSQELYIKVNETDKKEKIIYEILNANWEKLYPSTKTPRLKQWQVYDFLLKKFPELGRNV